MRKPVYYWFNNKLYTGDFPEMSKEVLGSFCIDDNLDHGAQGRIGKWGPGEWINLTADQLPLEFRAQLLLLGVPT